MTDKQTASPEKHDRPKNFLDRSGGFDPILAALSDILPAKVFEDVPLN